MIEKLRGRLFGGTTPDENQKLAAPAVGKVLDMSTLFLTGQQIPLYGSGSDSAYQNSWVAYSCIRRIAQDAAGVPLVFLRDPEDTQSEVAPTHPVRQMFARPNPYFSSAEFVEWLVNTLNRRGEFFVMFDDPARPRQMYSHSDPKHWRDVQEDGHLLGWEYNPGESSRSYLPHEVVHHRFLDPSRPFRGLPPADSVADAIKTHTGADQLTRNIVERGGEKAIVYQADYELTEVQRDQTITALRARHATRNQVGRDVLLPNGVKPIDPKYIDDDLRLLDTASAQPDKICAAFGVPKSLLGFEDIDKYATFNGRKRMFYTDTLVPMLTGVESAFDRMFVETLGPAYNCYVRFDWSSVPAMQEDLGERFDTAIKVHAAGVPWGVCNDRFELGLDVDSIPGSDTVLVSSGLAPADALLEQWTAPQPPPAPAGGAGAVDSDKTKSTAPKLTNAVIKARALDTRSRVQRHMRQLKLEKQMREDWRALLTPAMNACAKGMKDAKTEAEVVRVIERAFDGLATRGGSLANRYHTASALEGETSIVELVDGKMDDATHAAYKAVHKWRPDVEKFIRERENLIVGLLDNDLFEDIKTHAVAAVKEGVEASKLQHLVRARWQSAPGGINRAVTIARTEIGTAYNVARFHEIKGQGFKRHKWLTAGDEVVRTPPDSEFDHLLCDNKVRAVGDTFPCGLEFPQSPGGKAGNVINCRCDTIPVTEE